jgi:hypothetical protein
MHPLSYTPLQEKFYPGDRVCVLDREIKEEKVDMSRWTKKRKREHFKAIADAKHAVSEEGLLAKADQNGDGQIDAAELEALAKDVPRGRTGVVCKFADDANRVVIEFDEEVQTYRNKKNKKVSLRPLSSPPAASLLGALFFIPSSHEVDLAFAS